MSECKLVSLDQFKILAEQTKLYVDGKVDSASVIQSGDTVSKAVLAGRHEGRRPRPGSGRIGFCAGEAFSVRRIAFPHLSAEAELQQIVRVSPEPGAEVAVLIGVAEGPISVEPRIVMTSNSGIQCKIPTRFIKAIRNVYCSGWDGQKRHTGK